ncbi:MAG: low molecular weight phosphatase family protein [Clostridia bacterium]|nr:low molecular weight phosphatase family protein [Clostridia bacterium]
MKTIVFVCTGNTCRSPMAEGMFRVLAEKYGVRDVTCTSCGTAAYTGMPATPYAVSAAAAYGADISAHRSRPLTEYLLREGDLFVGMTRTHANVLRQYLSPEKVRVLGDGIPDPFGGSQEDYRDCAAAIYAALDAWLQQEGEKPA